MQIEIETTNNGYIAEIKDSLRNNGRYVYRSIDVLSMIEFLGTVLNDKRITVQER